MSSILGGGGMRLPSLAIPTSQLPALTKAFKPLHARLAASPGIGDKSTVPTRLPKPTGKAALSVPIAVPFNRGALPAKLGNQVVARLQGLSQKIQSLSNRVETSQSTANLSQASAKLSAAAAMTEKVSQLSSSADKLGLKVLMETAKVAQADRQAARESVQSAFGQKIDQMREKKAHTAERHQAERSQAWANVGIAAAAAAVSIAVSAAGKAAVKGVIQDLKSGQLDKAVSAWSEVVGKAGSQYDINALSQHVLREAFVKGSPLDQLKSLPTNPIKSGEEWDAYIEKWEQQLQTVGDDAQLANIDLQNMLQKQQQTLQLMSNVSKMLHDTAMAVVRKIG